MTNPYLARPTKAEIVALPDFKGLTLDQIHLVHTDQDLAFARQEIGRCSHIGFDTESKPSFIAGETNSGPHIVQIATDQHAFIFSLANQASHSLLAEVVASEQLIKLGFGLKSDSGPLQRKLGTKMGAVLELSRIVKGLGYKDAVGLKAAVAIVLGEHIRKSKKITTSNWAAETLSTAQLLYAANDAYASLRVYLALGLHGSTDTPRAIVSTPR